MSDMDQQDEETQDEQTQDDDCKDGQDQGQSGSDGTSGDGQNDEDKPSPPPTWLVWITRILSGGILAAIVGYLLYLSVLEDIPPEFTITPKFDQIVENDGRYALPVSIRNGATEAVTDVKVEISLGEETRTLTLPLMGQGETASLEVVFRRRPTEGELQTMVLGYQAP